MIDCGSKIPGFWQAIQAECLPPYCTHCLHQGHADSACKILHNEKQQTTRNPSLNTTTKVTTTPTWISKPHTNKGTQPTSHLTTTSQTTKTTGNEQAIESPLVHTSAISQPIDHVEYVETLANPI